MKDYSDYSHQIIKEQFAITNSTHSLMEKTIDKLNIMEEELGVIKDELVITKDDLDATKNRVIQLGNAINNLTDMKAHIELLQTFCDWIRKFLKIIKLGGENEWCDVRKAISDFYNYDMDVSKRKCIKELNKILNGINMNINDFELLLEMKEESNGRCFL